MNVILAMAPFWILRKTFKKSSTHLHIVGIVIVKFK